MKDPPFQSDTDYNSKEKTASYELEIRDRISNQDYDIDVNEKLYNMFKENERVKIKARKGCLGVVYDEWFYKE